MAKLAYRYLLLILITATSSNLLAQNLEPRRWTHIPVGTSFFGLGLNHSDGDIFFDPVLRIEDAKLDLTGMGVSYVHSFEWLGRTARIDATLPMARGTWKGLLNGMPAEVKRQGFSDPYIRLSMNLWGAPPLRGKEFMQYRASKPSHTTVGAAIAVVAPLGEYSEDQLINLGGNRWILRPQLGVLHDRGPWEFEATGSVFLFGKNHHFFRGSTLEQEPLWFMQAHIVRKLQKGFWAGVSGGYGYGGESTVSGVKKDDDGRVRYFALNLGVPISRTQGLKLSWISSRTNTLRGLDLNTLSVSWTLMMVH